MTPDFALGMTKFEIWSLIIGALGVLGTVWVGLAANKISKEQAKDRTQRQAANEIQAFKDNFALVEDVLTDFQDGDIRVQTLPKINRGLMNARLELGEADVISMWESLQKYAMDVRAKKRDWDAAVRAKKKDAEKKEHAYDTALDDATDFIADLDYAGIFSNYIKIKK